jgi:CheY-like chemotaxis protein
MHYVLIVDDSDVDRLLMEGLLKKMPGFEVIGARDGVHALEQLKAWSIDMVITDIQMPKMDGLALMKAARKDYPDIPVVLTTGMGSEEIAAVALKAGAASYIPKSRLNKMLISTVEETFDMMSSERNFDDALMDRMWSSVIDESLSSREPRFFIRLIGSNPSSEIWQLEKLRLVSLGSWSASRSKAGLPKSQSNILIQWMLLSAIKSKPARSFWFL